MRWYRLASMLFVLSEASPSYMGSLVAAAYADDDVAGRRCPLFCHDCTQKLNPLVEKSLFEAKPTSMREVRRPMANYSARWTRNGTTPPINQKP